MFITLIVATLISTIACLAALELSVKHLPPALASAHLERAQALRALSDRVPWLTPLARVVVFGYLASLIALAFDVPGARYALLVLTIGWTGLSTLNAPNIQHRVAVPFHELSLLLNGAVLAVAFMR